MNENEKKHFLALLQEASDALSNNGCNDYDIKDTPENRELATNVEMHQFDCKTIEEWKAHKEYSDLHIYKGKIWIFDTALLSYLIHKMEKMWV